MLGGSELRSNADLLRAESQKILAEQAYHNSITALDRAQGTILVITADHDTLVEVQVHDSGPGLSSEAASTLFAPTITFKVDGMGLGLSIAKKNALLCGGDIEPMAGELGGAAFRVTLPRAGAQAGFVIPDTDVSIEVPDATAVHTR